VNRFHQNRERQKWELRGRLGYTKWETWGIRILGFDPEISPEDCRSQWAQSMNDHVGDDLHV